jgi:hypothetical protein
VSKLLDALKRKFATPEDAMRALGLNPGLLAMDTAFTRKDANMPIPTRLAARNALRRRLSSDRSRHAFDSMSDEDIAMLVDAYADGGDGSGVASAGDQYPTTPRGKRLMTHDQVDEIMGFLAECGLSDDDLKQAGELLLSENDMPTQDARVLAHDAKSRALAVSGAAFVRLFPNAGRSHVLPSDHEPSRPARIDPTARSTFARLFPSAPKLRVL